MRLARPVRLPLQIGVAAVWNMARSALAMLFLLAMSLHHGIAWLLFGGALGVVLGLVLLIYAAMSAATAGMAWPTDLFIDSSGICVEGGLEKPKSWRWDELDIARCVIEDKQEKQRSLAK